MTTSSNDVFSLGVYLGHDCGACLLKNGTVIALIEEERLNRYKHGRPNYLAGLWSKFAGKFGYFPWASMSYCLDVADVQIDQLDTIVIGDEIWADGAQETISSIIPIKNAEKIQFADEPLGGVHHYNHALSAFYGSDFDEAAVLVIDADGSRTGDGYEAESGYVFDDRQGSWRHIFKNRYGSPHIPRDGIGWMYEQVTRILGFFDESIFLADAGKTMGLASYGAHSPAFAEPWIVCDGFKLDFTGFKDWLIQSGNLPLVLADKGDQRRGDLSRSGLAADLAFKAQYELEAAVMHVAQTLRDATGATNLCLAGGVALNSVANGKILRSGMFDKIFVQPAANDGGQALGLAYSGHLSLMKKSRANGVGAKAVPIPPIRSAIGGKTYCPTEIGRLLDKAGLEYEVLGDAVAHDAAEELATSKFVGWLNGGSEFGPRALGRRSILADPRGAHVKDALNARIKFRESFRPFAPSVLKESASAVFDIPVESPYMLMVAPVRSDWCDRVPAIVHVDGSARIQTVDRDVDPLYHSLISRFERITGVPVVLNTSFNLKGMPIVESPYDALECFLFTNLDVLYLQGIKVTPPPPEKLAPEFSPAIERSISGANGGTLYKLFDADLKTEVSLPVATDVAQALEKFDGARTIGDVCASSPAAIADVLDLVKICLRSGAMTLNVGDLRIGRAPTSPPWWQRQQPL